MQKRDINSPDRLIKFSQVAENNKPVYCGAKFVGQKTSVLQKRIGEVIENKGSAPQNGTKRTEKRTGQVI
jgi:hypothetical protein